MKETKFKPLLGVDVTERLDELEYPLFASPKLDGVRMIIKDGELLTRSLKAIPNKQLHDKFAVLKRLSKELNLMFDGEVYSHKHSFQDIVRAVMTHDFEDEKTISKLMKEHSCSEGFAVESASQLIDDMEYHVFDMVDDGRYDDPFHLRMRRVKSILNLFVGVEQIEVNSKEDVLEFFDISVEKGYEGVILRNPDGIYKHGRSTFNEGYLMKVKPFVTEDARIIGVVQATVVNPDAERKINELGHSVTSKKKDDRIPIQKASVFVVDWNGVEQDVSIALPDVEKERIWQERDSYIGRMIEFKGMKIGMKDKLRHPVLVRFRDDR